MKKAFLLHNESDALAGGYDVVTASKLREMKKEAARDLNFACAYPGCLIKVFPVFPVTAGIEGKVLECHFRAPRGVCHIGHGTPPKTKENAEASSDGESTSSNQPSGWREPSPPKQSATSASLGQGRSTDIEGGSESEAAGKINRGGVGAAPSKTSSLRKLVERWESEQPEIRIEEFTFPGRRNVIWSDVFVEVGGLESEHELAQTRRCIFYGNLTRVKRWGNKAFELEFSECISGRLVSCYVKMSADQQAKHPVLTNSLIDSERKASGRAYVLGTLMCSKNDDLKISIDSCSYVWVVN